MKHYELSLIFDPTVGEEQLNGAIQRVTSFLQEQNALISNQGVPGKRALLSPIHNLKEAALVVLNFSMEQGRAPELQQRLTKIPSLLRSLLITAPLYKKRAGTPRIAAPSSLPSKDEQGEADSVAIDKELEEIFQEQPKPAA